jgi:hypothetical protein
VEAYGLQKGAKNEKMNVKRMFSASIILRNAHVTMNACNTALYFNCLPQEFEDWIKEGPRRVGGALL